MVELSSTSNYVGLSSDAKPTAPVGSELWETDTGKIWRSTGSTWVQKIDAVGGSAIKRMVEFTRPANATAYAANDTVGVNLTVGGATNASPIVISTNTHSLNDGDPITIASVGGNTNANGNWFAKVTGYSLSTFALYTDKALTLPRVGNSNWTSGGTIARLFRLQNIARVAGGSGYIVKARLTTDQKAETWQCRIHLFNTPVAAILDNSLYTFLWANRQYRVGYIDLPALSTEDSSGSTGANALAVPTTSSAMLPLKFICGAGDADLYFMVETKGVFTPGSASNLYFEFVAEND
jgi:hypothetical protein